MFASSNNNLKGMNMDQYEELNKLKKAIARAMKLAKNNELDCGDAWNQLGKAYAEVAEKMHKIDMEILRGDEDE